MAYLLLIIGLLCITLGLVGCSLFVISKAISKSNLKLTFTNITHYLDQKDNTNRAFEGCSASRSKELRDLELRLIDRFRKIEKKIDLLMESNGDS